MSVKMRDDGRQMRDDKKIVENKQKKKPLFKFEREFSELSHCLQDIASKWATIAIIDD